MNKQDLIKLIDKSRLPQGVDLKTTPEWKRLGEEIAFFEANPSTYTTLQKLIDTKFKGESNRQNCLAVYLLGITSKAPDLSQPFAPRKDYFLTRFSPPDIDVDFESNGPVYEYIIRKYGANRVANIGTWSQWKIKGAVQDAVKYNWQIIDEKDEFGNPMSIDQVAKIISVGIQNKGFDSQSFNEDEEEESEQQFNELLQQEHVAFWYQKYPKVFEDARKMLGIKRFIGKHAAGIVISDIPIAEIIPLHKGSNGEKLTQFDLEDTENLGLLKMDVLGLNNLKTIHMCNDLIRAKTGNYLDVWNLEPNDQLVFKMLGQGVTQGIFQFEGWGMTKLLKEMQPTLFADLIAAVALYRPGPLKNKFHELYVERKRQPYRISYPHPHLKPVLEETLGVFLYQEQIMASSRILAGFSYTESDEIRKVIGKKQLDKLPKLRKKFIDRCASFGVIAADKANRLFDQFEAFGEYAFNKSHSVTYSFISYVTGYLKAYHTMEFFASLMTTELECGTVKPNEKSKLEKYREEAEQVFKIKFLPVDINLSRKEFTIENGNCLRFPIGSLKHCGGKAEDEIIANQPYKDIPDFVFKVRSNVINSATLEVLIDGGVFSSFGTKKEVRKAIEQAKIQRDKHKGVAGKKTVPYIPTSVTTPLF